MPGTVLGMMHSRNRSPSLMELIRESNNKCIQFLCEKRMSVIEGNRGGEEWICWRKLGQGGGGGERLNLCSTTHRMSNSNPGQDKLPKCEVPGRMKM